MTIKAFVVGHPIAHSRSPLIHGYWLRRYGIDGSYERVDVSPDAFAGFLASLRDRGFAGGNVTVPHKEAAFRLAPRRSARAERIGAVNTLAVGADGAIQADNTDALGFTAHLDASLGADWPERLDGRVVVLGAGGAARAIVVGLLERGIGRIAVANRSPGRAESLRDLDRDRVGTLAWQALPGALAGCGLLVNTTSLGMTGHPALDLDLSPLPEHAAVADIVYAPLETALLAAARARGLRIVDGLGMLLHQAVPGFTLWFGIRPEVTPDLRALIVADLEKR